MDNKEKINDIITIKEIDLSAIEFNEDDFGDEAEVKLDGRGDVNEK